MFASAALLSIVGTTPILWSTDASPDGALVATSGSPSSWLYNAETLRPEPGQIAWPDTEASAVRFHPESRTLAVSGAPPSTGLYRLDTGAFTPIETEEGARGIGFNHDGSLVGLAEHSGAFSVWTTGDEPALVYRDHPEDGKSLTGITWHPTKNIAITIGEFVTLYDLAPEPPRVIERIEHRADAKGYCLLLGVDWHPDGASFAVSDYGNHDHDVPPSIQIRSADGTLIRSIERPGSAIRNIRWSPDGSRLAAATDGLVIYSADGRALHETPATENLWGLDWAPDGLSIFTTDQSGRAHRWTPDASEPEQYVP